MSDRKKLPGSARADELKRELQKSTDFRRRHVDEEKLKQKALLRTIIETGTEEEFQQGLKLCGINEDTAEGQQAISAFRKLRGID